MSNSLTNIMPKILARALMVLREQCVMPRLVNGDYGSEAAQKGSTIDVPIGAAQTAYDVSPSAYLSATDHSPGLVQVALDQWKGSNFYLTDKELVEIDRNSHFLPVQAAEAIRALSNAVNTFIHGKYTGVYGYVGTAGTTPFASTVNAATDVRKVLNEQLCPKASRRGVLDFAADANALALAPFADADKTLSAQVKIEGEIGRKYGIDWVADDAVVTHTAGSLQSIGGVVGSTTAANASSLDVASASTAGNLVVGDIFTIAGQTQTYVVQSTVSAITSGTAQAVSIDPPLAAIATAAAAITIKATHVVNLVFHRDAFAFANRPLVASTQDLALGSQIMSMTDPQTGITLRLEVSRQNKRVVWEFDILFGAALVQPKMAARLAG